jgi:cobalt-zinc-cadmium efflux system protein
MWSSRAVSAHDHGTSGHSHQGAIDAAALAPARRRALWFALIANAAFLVIQMVAALATGSLSLFADSIHMISDVAALFIALIALRLVLAPASPRHTYGLVRAEVISGLANALLLLVASVWIVIEAVNRLDSPESIKGGWVMIVAAIGFVVNAASAWGIARVGGANLNLRGAFWHLTGDALGSIGALLAGAAALFWGADWVDPLMSLLIVALIVVSAIGLVRDALRVLLESTPAGISLEEVEAALAAMPDVDAVHHTHIWSLGSESAALSTHVVLAGEPSLHDAQAQGEELKHLLADRFSIQHATIELECHDCEHDNVHGIG